MFRRDCVRTATAALLGGLALLVFVLPASGMDLGTNFWNLGWHRSSDCFQDVNNVAGDNPWNPQFLREIAVFRSFRFMDWDNTNGSTRGTWSERPVKSAAKQNPVAYEWMIDLCNRMNAAHGHPPSDRWSRLRRADILDAARRLGRGLVARWPEFLARTPDSHVVLGAVGAFGLLQQLLPETFVDHGRWTDIFSDERRYQTRQVEMLDENRDETATPNGKRP